MVRELAIEYGIARTRNSKLWNLKYSAVANLTVSLEDDLVQKGNHDQKTSNNDDPNCAFSSIHDVVLARGA